ncbi:hypothetical protein BDY24DRAFT_338124 [Mrakia frigida]|uniref:rRNA-processing protein NOP12 n=1 Tax=Mrakia frigida TaxID=29902 RepID=UPI003FCC1AA7
MGPDSDDEEEEEEGGGEASTSALPVHESLLPGAKPVKQKKVKAKPFVPEGETRDERDGRTIFVGNLGVEVAKSKPFLHLLHAHLLASIPLAKIESTRFRSVAFSKPTEELPAQDAKEEENRAKARQKERTKSWREEIMISKEGGVGKGGEAEMDRGKSYLTPGEKRKVAFIKKDFHPGSDHVNAYIVFSYPSPTRSSNVPPILPPHEAATLCAQHCNGTTFQGRTIRVDQVRQAASTASTARATSTLWVAGTDPKRSVFVGNLEFAAKEEEVRLFFEGLVEKERGKAKPEVEGGEARWVTNVRIVRDRATGLGKGFAYVALKDRESVDEILVLEESKLKYGKRTLRVQRCKSLPAKPKVTAPSSSSLPIVPPNSVLPTGSIPESFAPFSSRSRAPHLPPVKIVVPKGNPLLGETIKDLSKEERKVVKGADAERMARRVAKKKARTALERSGAAAPGGGGMKERVKLDGGMGGKGGKKKPGVGLKAKKGRTRSAAAEKGRNAKKA